MRTATTVLTVLLLLGALAPAAAQPPAPGLPQAATYAAIGVGVGVGFSTGPVGVDVFYSNLAPYGYWVNRPSYGWVWTPRHIRHHWRPYLYGRWVYTDYGWTWLSDEPYGWATYHYGRWYDDPDYGWSWVPGYDWGPAWVAWQAGDGYVGWAALPPAVGFDVGVGLQFGSFDLGIGLAPAYCFVPERSFLAVNVATFVDPPFRNATIIRNTTNVTNFTVQNGRVFNNSLAVNRVQQMTGQPVRQMRLAAASDPRTARVSGNTVSMFRPASVVKRANAPDPTRVAPRSVATGRVAQQLQQERRGMATAAAGAAGARGAQATRQAQVRPQGGMRGGQAMTRGRSSLGTRQHPLTPPPQRTRGGTPPRRGARSQQVHQYVPPSGHARNQSVGRQQLAQRQGRQQVTHRQVTPPPQRTRGGTPPRQGARSQQVHQYVPPPQQARGRSAPMAQRQPPVTRRESAPPPMARRESAPPPQQMRRESAPPPQQMRRESAPPPMARPESAPPPQRQAQFQRPAPAPRQAPAPRPAPRSQPPPERKPPPPAGAVS
jgi:hypothetical protein